MIINSASVGVLKVKLVNADDPKAVLDEVRAMLEAKTGMLSSADDTAVSKSGFSEKDMLLQEIEVLGDAMKSLNNNNVDAALRKLDEYQHYLAAREEGRLPEICEGCMTDKRIII